MKRILCLLITLTMVISLAGCSGKETSTKPAGTAGSNTVQNVLNEQIKNSEAAEPQITPESTPAETQKNESTQSDTKLEEPENAPAKTQKPASAESNAKPDESKVEESSYDVDLTKLSSTMVYSEVFNMMSEPETYIGKYVRMNGQFAIYQVTDEQGRLIPDQIYFACIIADATACCSQGLEFVLAGEHTYPDDYPELGDDIVVSGIFETYDENGYMYCHLINAVFE